MEKERLHSGAENRGSSKAELPVLEVGNVVSWVNPNFPNLPFNLKKGDPCKFGLFLTPGEIEREWHSGPSDHIFGISPRLVEKKLDTAKLGLRRGHYRSGKIGEVFFEDKKGNRYRDVDLKGVGFLGFERDEKGVEKEGEPRVGILVPDSNGLEGDHVYGLRNKKHAMHDAEVTEAMHQLGVRTHRVLAITDLKEIIVSEKGYFKKISIDEAKQRRLIPHDMEPVVEVRTFGTKIRVLEWGILRSNEPFKRKDLFLEIEDARNMLMQELRKAEREFDIVEYFKWLANTMGKNLGLMHKFGWKHGYAHGLNMTLDGRLVDFDSAGKIEKVFEKWESINQSQMTLKKFEEVCFITWDASGAISDLEKFFNEAVKSICLQTARERPNELLSDDETINRLTGISMKQNFWRGYNLARFGKDAERNIAMQEVA